MTWEAWIVSGCFVSCVFICYCLKWCVDRELAECKEVLEEAQRVNDELVEAIALARYGAYDEAVEVAMRSTKRRQKA